MGDRFRERTAPGGNAALSMTWEKGRLVTAEITVDSDYHAVAVHEGQSRDVTLKAGEGFKLV